MKLTRRQLYSRRDPTRAEMLLTRAIHHLMHLRRKSRGTDAQYVCPDEALETLFEAKRQVKAQIKAENAEKFSQSTFGKHRASR